VLTDRRASQLLDRCVEQMAQKLPGDRFDHLVEIDRRYAGLDPETEEELPDWLFRRRRPPGPKEDAHPFRAKTPTGFEGLRPRSERSDAGMWWLVSSSGLWSASYRVGPGLVA
jgi:hypothetical protein